MDSKIQHCAEALFERLDPRDAKILARVTLHRGSPADFPEYRNLAYCEATRPPKITYAPKLAGRPTETILAILAHEYAHAYCMLEGLDHSERECDSVARALFELPLKYDRQGVQIACQTCPMGTKAYRPRSLH